MGEIHTGFKKIKFRKVLLSDLGTLIEIYWEASLSVEINKGPKNTFRVSENFGLPVVIAEVDNKVVGYASISIEADVKQTTECHLIEGYENLGLEKELRNLAENITADSWKDSARVTKLKKSISILNNWLNLCY